MKTILHPKIKELKLRAKPVEYSGLYVDKDGKLVDVRTKASEDGYELSGYLAVFGIPDDKGTVAVRGCFAKSIQERGPASTAKYKITLLYNHRLDDPIGRIVELEEDEYGLRFKAILDKGVPSADRCAIQYRSGTLNQFSYGFEYVWDKMSWDDERNVVLMHECNLWEGTCCTIGQNQQTYAIRGKEDFDMYVEELQAKTDLIIRSVPRAHQMELKQLIAEHISLYSSKPVDVIEEVRSKKSLDFSIKPSTEDVSKLSFNLTKF
jgi:HK97 family phage prohead protease